MNLPLSLMTLVSVLAVVCPSLVVRRRRNVLCNKIPDMVLTEILGPAYNSRYMSIEQPVVISEENSPNEDGTYKRKADSGPSFYVDDSFAQTLLGDEPAWSVNHYKTEEKGRRRRTAKTEQLELEVKLEELDGGATTNSLLDDDSSIFPKKLQPTKAVKSPLIKQDQSSSTDNSTISLIRTKRGNPSTKTIRQWECESRINWLDLGPDYFPRYLRTVECTSGTCWYGHYKCRPRSFTVKILRRKRDKCTVASPGTKVGLLGLPSDLRELWVWEERAVNFCCDCAL